MTRTYPNMIQPIQIVVRCLFNIQTFIRFGKIECAKLLLLSSTMSYFKHLTNTSSMEPHTVRCAVQCDKYGIVDNEQGANVNIWRSNVCRSMIMMMSSVDFAIDTQRQMAGHVNGIELWNDGEPYVTPCSRNQWTREWCEFSESKR